MNTNIANVGPGLKKKFLILSIALSASTALSILPYSLIPKSQGLNSVFADGYYRDAAENRLDTSDNAVHFYVDNANSGLTLNADRTFSLKIILEDGTSNRPTYFRVNRAEVTTENIETGDWLRVQAEADGMLTAQDIFLGINALIHAQSDGVINANLIRFNRDNQELSNSVNRGTDTEQNNATGGQVNVLDSNSEVNYGVIYGESYVGIYVREGTLKRRSDIANAYEVEVDGKSYGAGDIRLGDFARAFVTNNGTIEAREIKLGKNSLLEVTTQGVISADLIHFNQDNALLTNPQTGDSNLYTGYASGGQLVVNGANSEVSYGVIYGESYVGINVSEGILRIRENIGNDYEAEIDGKSYGAGDIRLGDSARIFVDTNGAITARDIITSNELNILVSNGSVLTARGLTLGTHALLQIGVSEIVAGATTTTGTLNADLIHFNRDNAASNNSWVVGASDLASVATGGQLTVAGVNSEVNYGVIYGGSHVGIVVKDGAELSIKDYTDADSYTTTIDTVTYNAGDIRLGDSARIYVDDSGKVIARDTTLGSDSLVSVESGTFTINDSFRMGDNSEINIGSNGVLTITNDFNIGEGGQLTVNFAGSIWVGGSFQGGNDAVITIDGTLTTVQNFVLGERGQLTVNSGGSIQVGGAFQSNANAGITIDGSLTTGQGFILGEGGQLTVNSGGSIRADGAFQSNANAGITIDGSLTTDQGFILGEGGQLTVNSGRSLEVGGAFQGGNDAVITIDGTLATVQNFVLGERGQLTVSGANSVLNYGVIYGESDVGITVSDGGSLLVSNSAVIDGYSTEVGGSTYNAGDMRLGDSAQISVEGGGTMTVRETTLGSDSLVSVVSGTFDTKGAFQVGDNADITIGINGMFKTTNGFNIGEGGQVTVNADGNIDIGGAFVSNNNAEIIIDGTFTTAQNFVLGEGGQLTVNADGTLGIGTQFQSNANVEIIIDGTLTTTGNFVLGERGQLTVNSDRNIDIGGDFVSNANVEIIIDGTLTTTGNFVLGEEGRLTINSNGHFEVGTELQVGNNVEITIGGTFITGGDFDLTEVGKLTINSGGRLELSSDLFLNNDAQFIVNSNDVRFINDSSSNVLLGENSLLKVGNFTSNGEITANFIVFNHTNQNLPQYSQVGFAGEDSRATGGQLTIIGDGNEVNYGFILGGNNVGIFVDGGTLKPRQYNDGISYAFTDGNGVIHNTTGDVLLSDRARIDIFGGGAFEVNNVTLGNNGEVTSNGKDSIIRVDGDITLGMNSKVEVSGYIYGGTLEANNITFGDNGVISLADGSTLTVTRNIELGSGGKIEIEGNNDIENNTMFQVNSLVMRDGQVIISDGASFVVTESLNFIGSMLWLQGTGLVDARSLQYNEDSVLKYSIGADRGGHYTGVTVEVGNIGSSSRGLSIELALDSDSVLARDTDGFDLIIMSENNRNKDRLESIASNGLTVVNQNDKNITYVNEYALSVVDEDGDLILRLVDRNYTGIESELIIDPVSNIAGGGTPTLTPPSLTPEYNVQQAEAVIANEIEVIQEQITSGEQVTYEDVFEEEIIVSDPVSQERLEGVVGAMQDSGLTGEARGFVASLVQYNTFLGEARGMEETDPAEEVYTTENPLEVSYDPAQGGPRFEDVLQALAGDVGGQSVISSSSGSNSNSPSSSLTSSDIAEVFQEYMDVVLPDVGTGAELSVSKSLNNVDKAVSGRAAIRSGGVSSGDVYYDGNSWSKIDPGSRNIWSTFSYITGSDDELGSFKGQEYKVYSAVVGADKKFETASDNEILVGAYLGIFKSDLTDLGPAKLNTDIEGKVGGLYASYTYKGFAFNVSGSFSAFDRSYQREVEDATAKSNNEGSSLSGRIGVSKDILPYFMENTIGFADISGGVSYQKVTLDAYTERGDLGTLSLTVAEQETVNTIFDLSGSFGVNYQKDIGEDILKIRPYVKLGLLYTQELDNSDDLSIAFDYSGASSIALTSEEYSGLSYSFGGGIKLDWNDKLYLTASYDYWTRRVDGDEKGRDHIWTGKVGMRF